MSFAKSVRITVRKWAQGRLVYVGVSLFVGILFGLVVLGWGIWPLQYVDTTPDMLRSDMQLDYLRMAVDSYSVNNNANLARSRFEALGARKWDILEQLRFDSLADPEGVKKFEVLLASPALPGTSPMATETGTMGGDSSNYILPVILLLTVIIGGAIVIVFSANVRRRRNLNPSHPAVTEEEELSLEAEEELSESTSPPLEPESTEEGAEPLERFVTTYTIGDDLFEDSFTINSPSGEFLGACGVGISEPIGVGGQKKVTALEVWLFDRKPSRTSTIVLLSQYAFQKKDLRAGLAPRGKPILAEQGSDFWMETPGLQLRVVIRELEYGKGPLPQNSYFERLTLQLEIWPRSLTAS